MNGRPTGPTAGGPRLPLAPLLDVLPIDRTLARPDVVGPGFIAQAAPLLGISTRTLHRYRNHGIDAWTADQLAINAGWHPVLIWGQDWIQAVTSVQNLTPGDEAAAYSLSPSAR